MTRNYVRGLAAVATLLALSASSAPATTIIDLTTDGANNFAGNNIAAVGGSFIVQQTSGQSTGGAVVDPFVRLQTTAQSEEGYNTDFRPLELDATGTRSVTHALLLSDVPTVSLTVNGVTELYRQFVLDINQTSKNSKLSLNQVQIFLTDNRMLTDSFPLFPATSTSPPAIAFVVPGTDQVFSLNNPDPNIPNPNFLEIQLKDAGKSSSSPGDMFLYVRDAAFNVVDTTAQPYVVLYSQFGTPPGEFPNNGRFEEWGVLKTPPIPIPEPSTVALALTGLGTLGCAGLRRRSQSLRASD